jgi:hypothetical protein
MVMVIVMIMVMVMVMAMKVLTVLISTNCNYGVTTVPRGWRALWRLRRCL